MVGALQHVCKLVSDIKVDTVTPERLSTAEFMKILDVIHENHNLNRLVVDEVS